MLNITLTDGRQFQLDTISPVALKNEGTYGNGSIDWEDEGLYLYDIAAQIGIQNALAALVNGQLMPLSTFIKKDCTLQYVMANDETGKAMINRTVLFLLAYGIKSLEKPCKRVKSGIESNITYYDFELPEHESFTETDLAQAEQHIAKAIAENPAIAGRKVPYYTAKKELFNQGETHLLGYIDAHDDYGPVMMQVMNNFADPDQGLLLDDLSILKAVHLTQEQTGNAVRIIASLEL